MKNFTTAATKYGSENEEVAVLSYTAYQHCNGHSELVVSASGFHIHPTYSFLGASPDGSVHDPSDLQQPFGFLEVKCPYSVKGLSPSEACATKGFCCELDETTGQPKLNERDPYFAQVQGQMALVKCPQCNFVVYTMKGPCVHRIPFDKNFWTDKLLPKLVSFYNNCVVPEIVSPVHHIGLPIRNLTKY